LNINGWQLQTRITMSQLLVKLLEIDITPLLPHTLAGYSNRKTNYKKINDRLSASIICFNSNNTKVLFVSIDTLFVHQRLKEIILNAILKKDIQPENFFLTATHTHFAPSLDPDKPELGGYSQTYFDWVSEQLITGINSLENITYSPVEIRSGKKKVALSINRRRPFLYWENHFPKIKIENAPNYLKKINDELNVQSLWSNNKMIGVIWNYASHPTAYYEMESVTSHYIGAVRSYLKKTYGDEVTVCFLQGFAGDIRPLIPAELNGIRKKIKSFFLNKDPFVQITKAQYEEWVRQLGIAVDTCLRTSQAIKASDIEMKGDIIAFKAGEIMSLEKNENTELTIQRISISKRLKIIGISAEPLMGFQKLIQQVYLTDELIFCGYINTVFGYLPTLKDIRKGGYEVNEFQRLFNIKGVFKYDLEEILIKKLYLLK